MDSNSPKGVNQSGTSTGAADSAHGDDSLIKDEESGGLPSERQSGGSVGANQQLLLRLQDRQGRAQTPTRYTQSSGGVGAGGEGTVSLPQSRCSTPAGGARQAC